MAHNWLTVRVPGTISHNTACIHEELTARLVYDQSDLKATFYELRYPKWDHVYSIPIDIRNLVRNKRKELAVPESPPAHGFPGGFERTSLVSCRTS